MPDSKLVIFSFWNNAPDNIFIVSKYGKRKTGIHKTTELVKEAMNGHANKKQRKTLQESLEGCSNHFALQKATKEIHCTARKVSTQNQIQYWSYSNETSGRS